MKIKFKWEILVSENYRSTCRAKVMGGWLVRHIELSGDEGESLSMVFVADPEHKWEI